MKKATLLIQDVIKRNKQNNYNTATMTKSDVHDNLRKLTIAYNFINPKQHIMNKTKTTSTDFQTNKQPNHSNT